MNRIALAPACALLLLAIPARPQSTAASTLPNDVKPISVSAFPGADIGARTAAAMAACNPSPGVPCVLVLDASLASAPAGVLPTLCPQCSIRDERPAGPSGEPPALLASDTSVLDARYFGADSTGTLDSTAALLNAATASCLPSREVVPVFLPPGVYRIANLDLSGLHCAPYFETPNDQSVQIAYNGSGTAGDYLMKLPDMSFGGFRGIYFNGANPTTGAMATYGVCLTGTVDNNFWIQRSRFANLLSHAIYHTGNGFTNFHMDHLRFDAVNGCGVYLTGSNRNDGQPFSLTDFTLDSRKPYGVASKWLAANHIGNGVNWGDAVVCVNNGTNILLDLEDARIEDNSPQVPIGNNDNAALVREWNTLPGQALIVNIDDVMTADVIPAGSTVEPALVASENGRVRLTVRGSESLNAIACIKNVATQTYYGDKFCSQDALFTWGYNRQQAGGLSMGAAGTIPNQIESIGDSALSANFARFHMGDLLLRPDTEAHPGIDGPVRWVTAPLTGACETAPHLIASDASVTAGNPSISFGADVSVAKLGILPGDNITIGAAGAPGIFATQVASVSYADNTLTVNPAPPSSANPAQLAWVVCTIHELPGAQSAAAPPKSGVWATGERVWNTNIAPGQPTFWACAQGGTPCRQWVSGPAYGPAAQ
jgi:hypothetical protein